MDPAMFDFLAYYRTHGPRAYPASHKRCMGCGEIIPWNDDCSHGHFAQIGREIRRKAAEKWGPTKRFNKKEKVCLENNGPSSSDQPSLLGPVSS